MICSTVDVAVRIRPLVPFELENGSQTCVAVVEGKEKIQVVGSEKLYRFDHVFGPDVNNKSFYNSIVRNKVAEVFYDRDVMILAYGQRHGGKTHTMGTNYTVNENLGIIPQAIDTLFNIIDSNSTHEYKVTVTFTEVYNKELYDLLASNKEGAERIVEMKKNRSQFSGLTESQVTNVETAMQCLVEGSQKRVTSEKRENSQSTRSHAIFTLTIYQRKNVDPRIETTSKLHLVDLAGSKHAKKNDNKAKFDKDLLAIRNWINSEQKGDSYTDAKYQSSKLAIFLRESLRKNSVLLIIACVSPADYCLIKTLQTLRYANRLRKIKRNFRAKQTNPVENTIATIMDASLIEAKPKLINDLEVQQTTSTMDIQELKQSESHENMKTENILDFQDLIDCGKNEQLNWFERELDTDIEDAQLILTAQRSSKSGNCTYETLEDEVDDDWDAILIRNALKSNEFSAVKEEKFQRQVDDDWETTSIPVAKKPLESSKTKQEHFNRGTEDDIEAKKICDAQNLNNCIEVQQETFQTKIDDTAKAESFESAQKFTKFSKAEWESIPTERLEDSPSSLFSKIADFFLEPSQTEESELRKEIHNLRKKLRDRTAKLRTNVMDDLNLRERVRPSMTRRESAKLVVAKILEEFHEVLTYIVENSEIRDWIVRVFRRIRDLLDEQKKIAGNMLNRKDVDDETMDEKYAEHTMHQVDRYHELQGVNRCIALLKELLASLPKQSTTIGDILRNLEDTTNEIKKLEMEKVDLVEVLKCAEPLNKSRTLAEYGIDKVLELDEKISRLWRRRIKQMIASERREKFDQQIANMSAQIETLKSARMRLVEEMKEAEKQWNSASTSGEKKKTRNSVRTKSAKNSKVLRKCACKVSECLNRRCSCVKNGVSCINCNCNAELCQNSNKENNASKLSTESQSFPNLSANDVLKCVCTTDSLNRRCTYGKNGVICKDNCRCKPGFGENNNKENGTKEANCKELQAPSTSTDGKMKVHRAVSSLHVNSCVCRENGATCTNCNRSFKLRDYKAKARRRLFADIDNENEGNEESRKRPRLCA